MKEKRTRRWLSLLLTVVMVLSLFPTTVAYAAETEDEAPADNAGVEVVDVSEGIPADLNATAKEMLEDLTSEEPDQVSGADVTADEPAAEPADAEETTGAAANYELDAAEDAEAYTIGSPFYKIFHLDCGRKYFTVSEVKALIDALAKNGYTYMELAIGNDGLRFLLNDMSVTANDTTYTSDAVKEGIQAGNQAYNTSKGYTPDTDEWSQREMDEIIAYAKEKGIGIIPLLNTPGHMDAILDSMESVGISNPAYSTSGRTVDVTNTTAVNFTLALVNKYITYFAGKGCEFFNMGCDEYANDVSNSGFAGLISNGEYGSFVTYVNNMAAQVKAVGMTPMAFNDGIYYNSITSSGTFDTDIAIAYWTSGWPGYSPASASFLAGKGHKIINTNDAWYYVLGRAAGNSSGYTIATAQNGVKNTACDDIPGNDDPTASGCMVCLWCDDPSASYNDTEVANVTGLISTFAANNTGEFTIDNSVEDPEAPETEYRTITVSVDGTATDTIDGYNYAGSYETDDLDIATVSAKYAETAGSAEPLEVTSITSGKQYLIVNTRADKLLTDDTNNKGLSLNGKLSADSTELWTITVSGSNYTIQNADGKYLTIGNNSASVSSSSAALKLNYANGTGTWTIAQTVKSGWGSNTYYLNDYAGNANRAAGWNDSGASTDSGSQWKIYEVTESAEPSQVTTVTFTGVAVGETEVTIGHVHYTINVVAEDLSTVDPLQVELWITNCGVKPSHSQISYTTFKTGNSERPNGYYVSISPNSVYGADGALLSSVVPAEGTSSSTNSTPLSYWKGTYLLTGSRQTADASSGSDKTFAGTDFTYIRYYGGKWEISADRKNWSEITNVAANNTNKNQIVAYYLQETKVTSEITTLVKDYGDKPTAQSDTINKVALTFAVVYPDGTVSPAEGDMYAQSTLLYNYWNNRNIGVIVPLNNSDYEISKITVTAGTRDQSGYGQWGANDTITWDKIENDAGEKWYDEEVVWDAETNAGTEPVVDGREIVWPAYNTAKLVLIYLKPIHYDTNLIVNWVDDSNGGSLISTMEVAVSSDGTPTTFYNGLVQTSALPTEGVGGTFTLDNDAYVTNSSNVNQTFNKNISTVPGVADQYKTGLYQYVSAELSADGKTMTLHYNINSSKLSKNYVLDFGLPVSVPLSDFIENFDKVTIEKVEITSGNAEYDAVNKVIIYTPKAVMTGTATVIVKVTFADDSTVTYKIGFTPASNVLYEDDFLTENKTIGTDDKYKTWVHSVTVSGTQSRDQELRYGYDAAYATSTGDSMNARWTVGVPASGDASQYLTTTFTGTGFDLIGTAGYNTGYVYLSIKGNGVNKLIIIDTSYGKKEAADTLYQVPLAHVQDLQQGTYEVNIRAAYRADNETHPTAGTTVTIDGFRVYRSTTDTAYTAAGEQGAKYHNILSAIQYGQNGYKAAFVEGNDNYTLVSRTDYEAAGGPQNEVYLGKGQAVVLQTSLTTGTVIQVSARAVTDETDLNGQSITSNTEMYYEVPVQNGVVTLSNLNSDGLLALGNLKVLNTAQASASSFALEEVTEDTLQTASLMMVSYSAAPEAGTFTPEKLDVKVKSSGAARGNRRVTVTVTASADVAKLTINGETLNPVKVRKGKRGDIGECTYVFTDTFKRGETKSYDIIAYNADGAASETTTVTG